MVKWQKLLSAGGEAIKHKIGLHEKWKEKQKQNEKKQQTFLQKLRF